MSQTGLEIGSIIDGLALPEPLQVVFVQPVGNSFKVWGRGMRTGQYIERISMRRSWRNSLCWPPKSRSTGTQLIGISDPAEMEWRPVVKIEQYQVSKSAILVADRGEQE